MELHPRIPDSELLEPEKAAEQSPPARTTLPSWRHPSQNSRFPDPLLDLIAARFRLLGEPLRLKLLALLADEERSVGELVELTAAGQPNVSKHLAALAEGGLIRRRKRGTSTLYAIADPLSLTLCDVVCGELYQQFVQQAQALGWEKTRQEENA